MFPIVQFIHNPSHTKNDKLEKKLTELEKRVDTLERSNLFPAYAWNPSSQARSIFIQKLRERFLRPTRP